MTTLFKCRYCKHIKNDTCTTFNIVNVHEMFEVCQVCKPIVRDVFQLEAKLQYPCFVEHRAMKTRQVFDNFETMNLWIGKNWIKTEDYAFGFRKSVGWNDQLKESFIGEGKCGSLSDDALKKILENIILSQATFVHHQAMIYVGWRGFDNNMNDPRTAAKNCYLFRISLHIHNTVDKIMAAINMEEARLGLRGTPKMISSNFRLVPLDCIDLICFCFPDCDPAIKSIGTFEDLKEALQNPSSDTIGSFSNVRWIAKPAFITWMKRDLEHTIAATTLELRNILQQSD